jgi:mRNA interferase MazF
MKRGEIWTVSGGPGYAEKPRPALIVQSDLLPETQSVLTCGLTSHRGATLMSRPPVKPDSGNGIREASEVMIDKMTAVHRSQLGKRIGALGPEDMTRVEQAMLLVLGFGD